MRNLIKETYQYTDETLQSGGVISRATVTIAKKKVTNIQEGIVKVGEKSINFSAYCNGKELCYNIGGVTAGINAQGYVEEFVSSIEGSIE